MARSHRTLSIILAFAVTFCAAEPNTCTKTGEGCSPASPEEADSSVFLQGTTQVSTQEAQASGAHELKAVEIQKVEAVDSSVSDLSVEVEEAKQLDQKELTAESSEESEEVVDATPWKDLTKGCKLCIREQWKKVKPEVIEEFNKCKALCVGSDTKACRKNCRQVTVHKDHVNFKEHCADKCPNLPTKARTLLMLDVPNEEELDDEEASGAAFLDELDEENQELEEEEFSEEDAVTQEDSEEEDNQEEVSEEDEDSEDEDNQDEGEDEAEVADDEGDDEDGADIETASGTMDTETYSKYMEEHENEEQQSEEMVENDEKYALYMAEEQNEKKEEAV